MRAERLEVLQRSERLAVEVYREARHIRDFSFRDQISRSVLSIPSNIVEGLERFTEQEKFRFISIAKGSSGEFAIQARIGGKAGCIRPEMARRWYNEAQTISRMLGGMMRRLKPDHPRPEARSS